MIIRKIGKIIKSRLEELFTLKIKAVKCFAKKIRVESESGRQIKEITRDFFSRENDFGYEWEIQNLNRRNVGLVCEKVESNPTYHSKSET